MPISKQTVRREVNVPSQSVVPGSDKGSDSGRKERGKRRKKNLRKELDETVAADTTNDFNPETVPPKVTQPETPSDLSKKRREQGIKSEHPLERIIESQSLTKMLWTT